MKLMVFVLDHPERLDELVLAWQQRGIDVVSIMDSSTLCQQTPFHIGARYGFAVHQRGPCEVAHLTLLAVLRDGQALQQAIEAAEALLGPLSQSDTGLLMAWDLTDVRGLEKLPSQQGT